MSRHILILYLSDEEAMMSEQSDESTYLVLDMRRVSRQFLIYTTILVAVALYYSALPHYLDESMHSNQTNYVIENYKTRENGSMYFEFVDNDGNYQYGELGDWFRKLLDGKYRFSYGNSFFNYCVERTVPNNEWMTSIFRSMNHIVVAQVLFRAAVLLNLTVSLFECVVVKNLPRTSCSNTFQRFFGLPLILLEFTQKLALFYLTCLHYQQDAKLIFLSRASICILTVSTILKLLVCAMEQTSQKWQIGCLALSAGVVMSHNVVVADVDDFLETPYCDSMATPIVVYAQLIYFLALLVAAYLRTNRFENLEMVTKCTYAEMDHRRQHCAN
ncbi:unnamed protein product [Caenorhabditis bovis]|uniref:Uncharacterized protein n=1 Tax=Caenorhabditis bovis TaxID=2654633 RepID=A0A8S1F662_9PELO|nr:unnamed protein product [Caenorhabditis bovis]